MTDKEEDTYLLIWLFNKLMFLPAGWEINANYKFFVFDQIRKEDLILQGGILLKFSNKCSSIRLEASSELSVEL